MLGIRRLKHFINPCEKKAYFATLRTMFSVSYTHLDVYKRQGIEVTEEDIKASKKSLFPQDYNDLQDFKVSFFVADTHSLVWYFTGSKKLGQKALEVFRNSLSGKSIIFIPTIVLAEIIDIIEKKRISVNYEELLDEIEKGSNFEIYPLDVNVLKTLKEIKGIL